MKKTKVLKKLSKHVNLKNIVDYGCQKPIERKKYLNSNSDARSYRENTINVT